MIDVVSSLRLSRSSDEQILYRLRFGGVRLVLPLTRKYKLFKGIDSKLWPQPWASQCQFECNVPSDKFSCWDISLEERADTDRLLALCARSYWQKREYYSLNNDISEGDNSPSMCALDRESFFPQPHYRPSSPANKVELVHLHHIPASPSEKWIPLQKYRKGNHFKHKHAWYHS